MNWLLLFALLVPTTKRIHHLAGHGEFWSWEYLTPHRVQDCAYMTHFDKAWTVTFEAENGKQTLVRFVDQPSAEAAAEKQCPSVLQKWDVD